MLRAVPSMYERMLENLRAFNVAFARTTRGGSVLELDGVVAALAPAIPVVSIINASVFADVPRLRAALPRLRDAYAAAGIRAWSVWADAEDEAAAEALEGAGLRLDSTPPGMAHADLAAVTAPADGELDWTDEPAPREYGVAMESAYGLPPGAFSGAIDDLGSELRWYVAFTDGAPVACAATCERDRVCGFYAVGTVPEARGGGLCSRLMRRAMADAAARGCEVAVLQASKMGEPVYARLGFRAIGRMHHYEHRVP
jgi:GNAT superfamily N-acetyltransferase